jgi:hypothetical protein
VTLNPTAGTRRGSMKQERLKEATKIIRECDVLNLRNQARKVFVQALINPPSPNVKMEDIDGEGKGGAAYEARGRVFESPRAYHDFQQLSQNDRAGRVPFPTTSAFRQSSWLVFGWPPASLAPLRGETCANRSCRPLLYRPQAGYDL